jgi:hypothetical protein
VRRRASASPVVVVVVVVGDATRAVRARTLFSPPIDA